MLECGDFPTHQNSNSECAAFGGNFFPGRANSFEVLGVLGLGFSVKANSSQSQIPRSIR